MWDTSSKECYTEGLLYHLFRRPTCIWFTFRGMFITTMPPRSDVQDQSVYHADLKDVWNQRLMGRSYTTIWASVIISIVFDAVSPLCGIRNALKWRASFIFPRILNLGISLLLVFTTACKLLTHVTICNSKNNEQPLCIFGIGGTELMCTKMM